MEFYYNEALDPNRINAIEWILIGPEKRGLFQRKDSGHPIWPGLWSVFGGVIEKGETLGEALEREFRKKWVKKLPS